MLRDSNRGMSDVRKTRLRRSLPNRRHPVPFGGVSSERYLSEAARLRQLELPHGIQLRHAREKMIAMDLPSAKKKRGRVSETSIGFERTE